MLEAKCGRCGETFIPHTEKLSDLIHIETEQGNSCGGLGTIQGEWIPPRFPNANTTPVSLLNMNWD